MNDNWDNLGQQFGVFLWETNDPKNLDKKYLLEICLKFA